ncbi:MAG: hypothetical protein MPK62_04465 [Alphaproteobacteria bacterium]|nr:hypothetical protein [Alphaproteobacteria bacterium]
MDDVKKQSYKHPEAKPLRELVGKTCLIHTVDLPVFANERDQDLKVCHFRIGKTKDNAAWYYSTSLVLLDQAKMQDRALTKNSEPIEAILVEKETSNGKYLVWE